MEIKLEDLFVKCEKCSGTGTLPAEITHSSRLITTSIGPRTCDQCGGRTGELTPNGEELQKFVSILKRHFYL